MPSSEHVHRRNAAFDAAAESGVEALVVGIGPDLEYLTGYSAHELERLSVLVLRPGDTPTMIIPELEAPGFPTTDDVELRTWTDGADAIGILVDVLSGAGTVAVGDGMRAHFVLPILERSGARLRLASGLLGPLRRSKTPHERRLLSEAGAAADIVTTAVMDGEVPLVGRTERDVAGEIRERLVVAGHDTAEFAIVASGPNAASPHHAPSDRVIEVGEIVLFDIGGRVGGYCSDTTRCVHTGAAPAELVEAWGVLRAAQEAAVAAAAPGTPCDDVDRAARAVIEEAGHGDHFIHRTGHGIGLQGHEEPYIVAGNDLPLAVGHAFSIEPGIYVAGRWGMRLEDIVVLDDDGLVRCNRAPRELAEV